MCVCTYTQLKRSYFFKVRDMETAWDQYTSANSGKGRVYTDKEISKYLKSAKKLEEEVEKKDKEYRVGVKKLEKARRQWEAAMEHGCHVRSERQVTERCLGDVGCGRGATNEIVCEGERTSEDGL